MKLFSRILITLSILTGCGSDAPNAPAGGIDSEAAARIRSEAIGQVWQLVAFGGQDTARVLPGTQVTLALDEDGGLSGVAGCNSYFGRWEISPTGQIAFSDMGWTEMACAGLGVMEQELRFLGELLQMSSLSVDDRGLELSSISGDLRLHFAGLESAVNSATQLPLSGPVWRLRFVDTVRLTAAGHAEHIAEAVPSDVEITAYLDSDGQVSGRAGCNRYFADYQQAPGGGIEFGPVGLTKMYCQTPPLMLWEARFVELLSVVESHHIEGERLVLTHPTGSLHFEATSPEPTEPLVDDWPVADVRLTSLDAGDHIELPRPGDLIEIALPSQPSTGFRWFVADVDSVRLPQIAERFDDAEPDRVGATGMQRFLFRANAPGPVELRLIYARSWEGEVEQTYEVGITVNGGIVPPALPPAEIRLGSSFGECMGYCWQEMILDAESMTLVSRGWDLDAYPEKIRQQQMDPELWHRLQHVADINTLTRMDEVYGCPDCADGGAEWLTMTLDGRQKTVRLEYGAVLKPVAEVLKLLREVRSGLVERD